jgi:hypothetical protein
MSVPPSRRPSSTPAPKGRPDEKTDKTEGKEFKLPARKQPMEGKEEQQPKKKGLFDIAAMEVTVQAKEQGVSQQMKTQAAAAGAVTGAEAVAQVRQIGQLVQKTVESMQIGQVGEAHFTRLNLKTSAEVPVAFAGSNLTVSYQQNGVVIKFDNFMSPQQENNAITLVEKNKEQLQDMVQALSSKNIQVTELSIGNHTIALPRVQPLPPPFQPTAAPRGEAEQQRGRGDQEGQPGGGEGGGGRRGPR